MDCSRWMASDGTRGKSVLCLWKVPLVSQLSCISAQVGSLFDRQQATICFVAQVRIEAVMTVFAQNHGPTLKNWFLLNEMFVLTPLAGLVWERQFEKFYWDLEWRRYQTVNACLCIVSKVFSCQPVSTRG